MTKTTVCRRPRHRWVKLRVHFYICRKCGCGKENVDQGGGSWSTKYHRPDGVSEFRRHTTPCEVGPKTAAYLAKYAKEIADAAVTPKVETVSSQAAA